MTRVLNRETDSSDIATSTLSETEQSLLTIVDLKRETAYDAAGALNELIEPAADAVSVFEDDKRFRIDAYYSSSAVGKAALKVLCEVVPECEANAVLTPIVQEDWVTLSQTALPPVHAGRFAICGAHDLGRLPGGPNTIVVEAGEAFGTAHHATTYGCLLAIDQLARSRQFRNVLDLGTGSGILALAMGRILTDAQITASDVDGQSIDVARANAVSNRLRRWSGGPEFLTADGVGSVHFHVRGPFDLIVANILARPLVQMAPGIAALLSQGAMLVLSGILVAQANEVSARYRSLGFDLKRHDRHHGWSTLTLQRRSQRRRIPEFNLYEPAYE